MPLPIVFSRRLALGRAPTRGAPPDCPLAAFWPWEGHPQGVPLPIVFSRRFALRRAPTRGAPTNCLLSAYCPGKGTHKGRPYRLSSLDIMPWEGHPQGVPLPIVFSRRYALGRAPTRGAPTDCLLSALCPGKGTHKGCPYRLSSLGVWPWEGCPQGAPLPIVFSRRYALGRAPTRGAPTDCLLSAFGPGKGTHKGCSCRLSSLGVWPWEGHPQGAPLPIVFSRRLALGRAPTRGAPTRFRQPYVGLSQFDAVALAVGVNPKVLGSRCLKQDLRDFGGFSGLQGMGRLLFGGPLIDRCRWQVEVV